MRRAAIALLALALPALPSAAMAAKTSTPIRVKTPSPGNATVAGFKLNLVHVKKKAKRALIAAGLPKNVTVYAVLAKQKRSDRVSGVLVAVNRSATVAGASAKRGTFVVNLKTGKLPKNYKLTSRVKQRVDVLSSGRSFLCSGYFKSSDLGNAGKLAGPPLPNLTIGTVIQSACASARSRAPYATLGEFRYALNARAGVMTFTAAPTFPNEVNGAATFNFPVQVFGVLADRGHQFTNCGFTGGTCAIQTTAHANDYALFTLPSAAAPGTSLPFALALSPNPTPSLPFQFFGMDASGARTGPLLTRGP
jgi:hypothetical protein